MGHQQLLLIILGGIVIAVAIAAGIMFFTSNSVSSNKDNITSDLRDLGSYAYGYKLRPIPFGGGGSAYTGFIVPSKFRANENATYSNVTTPSSITFIAVSKLGYGTITVVLDSDGSLSEYSYDGDFK